MDFMRTLAVLLLFSNSRLWRAVCGGFFGKFFLTEDDEDAQERKQIRSGGLRRSEAFGSSVLSTWTEAALSDAPLLLRARLRTGLQVSY